VPERVILSPETLTREDFLNEQNVEVRRIKQERMGERFVAELGGQVIESGPRGTLYEVRLPSDDLEGVARYAQVQDASTERRYFLRVPPTIQTAAASAAWTFQVAGKDCHPALETWAAEAPSVLDSFMHNSWRDLHAECKKGHP
jgi:Domain of unknown function (DUF6745)